MSQNSTPQPGRVVPNVSGLAALQVLTMGVRFPVLLVAAALLGEADFGRLMTAAAVLEVCRVLTSLGTDEIVTRELAAGRASCPDDPARAAGLRLLLSCLGAAAAVAIGLAAGPDVWPLVLVGILEYPLQALAESFKLPFRSSLRMTSMIAPGVLRSLAFAAGILCGAGLGLAPAWLMLAWPLAAAVEALAAHRVARPARVLAWPARAWRRSVLRPALSLGLISIAVMAYTRADMLMLDIMRGHRDAGVYAIIFRVSEALLVLSAASAGSYYALFSARGGDPGRLAALLSTTRRLLMRLAFALAAFAAVIAPAPLLQLFPDAVEFATALPVLVFSTVFITVNQCSTMALTAVDRQRWVLGVAAANLGVNVGLNLLLIPVLGILGACMATVCTEGINTLVQSAILRRALPLVEPGWYLAAWLPAGVLCCLLAPITAGSWMAWGAALVGGALLIAWTCRSLRGSLADLRGIWSEPGPPAPSSPDPTALTLGGAR